MHFCRCKIKSAATTTTWRPIDSQRGPLASRPLSKVVLEPDEEEEEDEDEDEEE
jgi:hypothetical protein